MKSTYIVLNDPIAGPTRQYEHPKITQKKVSQLKTITMNPNRMAVGKGTVELMKILRQQKTEGPKREHNLDWTSNINESWLKYVLCGIGIIGVILFIKKHL